MTVVIVVVSIAALGYVILYFAARSNDRRRARQYVRRMRSLNPQDEERFRRELRKSFEREVNLEDRPIPEDPRHGEICEMCETNSGHMVLAEDDEAVTLCDSCIEALGGGTDAC